MSEDNNNFDLSETDIIKTGKVRKRKGKKAALAAVCFILCIMLSAVSGALSSFFTVKMMTENTDNITENQIENEIFQIPESTTVFLPAVAEQQVSEDSKEKQQNNVSEQTKTKGDIYSEAVNSIVGITASSTQTYYTIFGQGYTQESKSTGSGFFVTNSGYIVTNYHVVDGAEKLSVSTYDGKEYPAILVGSENQNDIAVLKIEADAPCVKLGSSSKLQVGDDIMVIGNPLGSLSYTFTDGIVSYLSRNVSTSENISINMFQTNAAINSGNSGGPVYNMEGEVIGIASAKYSSEAVEGLGFCIPIDDVKNMINDIISHGYVTGKPLIGVSLQTITSAMSARYSLPVGCYVVAVGENSAAAEKIMQGDVITAVNNKKIKSCDDISAALSNCSAGDSVNIDFTRKGNSYTVSLVLDEFKPTDARTNYSNVFDY